MAATAMTFQNPYAHTAAGELGNNRETMLQNELLLRVRFIFDQFSWDRITYLIQS